MNNIVLSVIELFLIVILSGAFLYNFRTLDVDLSSSRQEYTLIIENTGQLKNTEAHARTMFDAVIHSTEDLIVIDAIPDNIRLIKRPQDWNGAHYYNKFSLDKYGKVVLFAHPAANMDSRISDAFIDSLVQSRQ
jgi:hypothetical protein